MKAVVFHGMRTGALDPAEILTQVEPMTSVIEAYKAFDERQPGWIKVNRTCSRRKPGCVGIL